MVLSGYIAVYVPTKDLNGRELPYRYRGKTLLMVEARFVKAFGGFTEYEAKGGWENEKGKIIKESVTVVKSFYMCEDKFAYAEGHSIALMVKERLSQECVTLEQNGTVSFI